MYRLLFGLALLFSLPAGAEELHLVTTTLPPFSEATETGQTGVAIELVQAMAKVAQHSGTIDMLPWARAQQMAQEGNGIALFPMGRNPDREPLYRWIVLLMSDPYLAVAKADSSVASVDDCKAQAVGVQTGGPGVAITRRMGIDHVQLVPEEVQNARKLLAGRIGCWFVDRMVSVRALHDAGAEPSAVKTLGTLMTADLYLAGSKSIGDDEAKRWQDALAAIKANGTYDRIIARYIGH
jgi:polar amino acid transport system substrate-binding protein